MGYMNSRQLQPFNTVQSLTPLGNMKAFSLLWTLNSALLESTCLQNPHQEQQFHKTQEAEAPKSNQICQSHNSIAVLS